MAKPKASKKKQPRKDIPKKGKGSNTSSGSKYDEKIIIDASFGNLVKELITPKK